MASTQPIQVDIVAGSGTTLAGNSVTPVSGDLYIVAVAHAHASVGTPTLTGTNGFSVTWTQVATRADAGSAQRITVFRGVASSGTAGVLTADFGGVSQDTSRMTTLRCPSINQASAQGVVQSVSATLASSTAPTVTFAAFGANVNVAIMVSFTNQNTTWTNSTAGWLAQAVNAAASGSLGAMSRAHATLDVTPTGTFGAAGILCTIGVELKTDTALVGLVATGQSPIGALPHIEVQQCHGAVTGVQVIGDKNFSFGGGGPTGVIGDPGGLSALPMQAGPSDGVGIGTTAGKWIKKIQRDDAVGNPVPSQLHSGLGLLRGFFVQVAAGARSISFDCKMEFDSGASMRPQLVIKANHEAGLTDDVTATAGAGTAWQTLTANFTAGRSGAVEVVRVNRQSGYSVWWDNLSTT